MAEDPLFITAMTFNIKGKTGKGHTVSARNTVDKVLMSRQPSVLFAQEIPAPGTDDWKFSMGAQNQYTFLTNEYDDPEATIAFRKEAGFGVNRDKSYNVRLIKDEDKQKYIAQLIAGRDLPIMDREDQRDAVTRLFKEVAFEDEIDINTLIDPRVDAMRKDILLQKLIRNNVFEENMAKYTYQARLLLDRCLGTYTNIRTRTCSAIVQHREGSKKILYVSWHGPEQGLKATEDIEKKKDILKDVLILIDYISQQEAVDGILIGGDFNLEAAHASGIAAKKGFEIKVDGIQQEKAIDYFMFRDQRQGQRVTDISQLDDSHSATIWSSSTCPSPEWSRMHLCFLCDPKGLKPESETKFKTLKAPAKNTVMWKEEIYKKRQSYQFSDFGKGQTPWVDFVVLTHLTTEKLLLCISWTPPRADEADKSRAQQDRELKKLMRKIQSTIKFSHEVEIPIKDVIVAGDFHVNAEEMRKLLPAHFEIRADNKDNTRYKLICDFSRRFELETNLGELDHRPITTLLDVQGLSPTGDVEAIPGPGPAVNRMA